MAGLPETGTEFPPENQPRQRICRKKENGPPVAKTREEPILTTTEIEMRYLVIILILAACTAESGQNKSNTLDSQPVTEVEVFSAKKHCKPHPLGEFFWQCQLASWTTTLADRSDSVIPDDLKFIPYKSVGAISFPCKSNGSPSQSAISVAGLNLDVLPNEQGAIRSFEVVTAINASMKVNVKFERPTAISSGCRLVIHSVASHPEVSVLAVVADGYISALNRDIEILEDLHKAEELSSVWASAFRLPDIFDARAFDIAEKIAELKLKISHADTASRPGLEAELLGAEALLAEVRNSRGVISGMLDTAGLCSDNDPNLPSYCVASLIDIKNGLSAKIESSKKRLLRMQEFVRAERENLSGSLGSLRAQFMAIENSLNHD